MVEDDSGRHAGHHHEGGVDGRDGGESHFNVRIVSIAFAGLSRVKQHQLVYAALKGHMGGELHALALETSAPSTTG